jgi:hypothetical protein
MVCDLSSFGTLTIGEVKLRKNLGRFSVLMEQYCDTEAILKQTVLTRETIATKLCDRVITANSKALVVALVVVVSDEGTDLALEITGQEIMLEQDTVLHGLVPGDVAWRAVSPARRCLPASRNSFDHE